MAIDFDGSGDYIDCLSDASIDDIAQISIVFWYHADTVPSAASVTVASKVPSGGTGWQLLISDGGSFTETFRWYRYWTGDDGDWHCGDNKVVSGAWHHVAVTYDKGATTNDPVFYIDGSLETTTEITAPTTAAATDASGSLWIAAQDSAAPPAYLFDGKIEDFRVANTIWTAKQIALLAAGYRGPLGGEVLWLSMNEARTLATPGTLTQGTHTLSDLSVNSNDGDPYGDAVLVASDCPRMGVIV